MYWWQLTAGLNAVIGVAYLLISRNIYVGLSHSGQLRTNRLGLATCLIFFTCAVHHGSHTAHLLLPYVGLEQEDGLAMRVAMGWHMAAWDVVGAVVAVYYVSLRGSYGRLLASPEMFEDQVRRATEDLLRDRAFNDALTALPNRAAFEQRIEDLRLTRDRAVVMFLDLDHFKEVNDSLGHSRGDETLILAGQRLRGSLRAEDELFRIGGDEFAVLCAAGTDEESAMALADRLLEGLRTVSGDCPDENAITASIGVAHAMKSDDMHRLLRMADAAMYRVKRRGGDAVCAYSAHEGTDWPHATLPGPRPALAPQTQA